MTLVWGVIYYSPLLKSYLEGLLQNLLLPWKRLIARALCKVVESWAKSCCWADMLDWDVFRGLYLLGKTPLLLKKLSQVQDGVFAGIKKNIVAFLS